MAQRLTLRFAASLVAATAVLSGCSDKQEANDTLPSTTAAETTPELPPLGPEDMPMPDEARTQDAAGAEAFVRYYIELINRTSTVMDGQALRTFSDGCRDCARIAANTEEDAAAGYDYQGGEITITEVSPALIEGTTASVAIRLDQAPLTVLDSSGTPLDGLGSDAYTGVPGGIGLAWKQAFHSWVMSDFTVG